MPVQKSSSSEVTKALAADIARAVLARGAREEGASIIALEGELGAGKTTFVQGFFEGLGLRRKAQSPTFILMRRTSLRNKPFKSVFHIDAYRTMAEDFLNLGIHELFLDPGNLFLVEWPERILPLLPKHAEKIVFEHGGSADERLLSVPRSLLS